MARGLVQARLVQARLVQARLVQARLVQARLVQARLVQARLVQARLVQARLGRAGLGRAGLGRAGLGRAGLGRGRTGQLGRLGGVGSGARLGQPREALLVPRRRRHRDRGARRQGRVGQAGGAGTEALFLRLRVGELFLVAAGQLAAGVQVVALAAADDEHRGVIGHVRRRGRDLHLVVDGLGRVLGNGRLGLGGSGLLALLGLAGLRRRRAAAEELLAPQEHPDGQAEGGHDADRDRHIDHDQRVQAEHLCAVPVAGDDARHQKRDRHDHEDATQDDHRVSL
ncbi:pentapeptide repeat-containing protein [Actinomadura barringtoniae]|uniref:pentapeptide repeat-containing protein n=1 Tax=Actinomadura barringtoniae TaxID=1427535 RepID=UPI003555C660